MTAGTRISALPALAAAAADDRIPIVDISAGVTKYVLPEGLQQVLLAVTNSASFNQQGGGSVHYTVPIGDNQIWYEPTTGTLFLGPNYLFHATSATSQASLADWAFDTAKLRQFTRNITLAEISDPADLDLRRFGPEGMYPYAKDPALGTHGTYADLTGLAAGALVGQVRSTAGRVPYGGDETTPGGAAVESGALMAFQTSEMPRQITPNNQMAVGMRIYFSLVPNGSQDKIECVRIENNGHLMVGPKAIEGGDTGALLQIRGHEGTNAKHTLTMTGAPTGGTFTATYYKFPTTSAEYPASVTTAAIARTATAANVRDPLVTAIQGLAGNIPGTSTPFSSVTSADIIATGGPINTTPVVLEYTGLLGLHRQVKLETTSSLTGGTAPKVTVAETVAGIDHQLGNRCLNLRGTTGQTADYMRVQDGAGAVDVLRLDKDGALIVPGQITASGVFRHTGSTVAFFGSSPIAQRGAFTQTYSTATRTMAARAASALGDSTSGTPAGTVAAIPNPADSPATADALRDDLVANTLPAIRNALASIITAINNNRTDGVNNAGVINALIDDSQAYGLST